MYLNVPIPLYLFLQLILADYYAFKGDFQEAAKMYKKCGNEIKAMEMFSDLRQVRESLTPLQSYYHMLILPIFRKL